MLERCEALIVVFEAKGRLNVQAAFYPAARLRA